MKVRGHAGDRIFAGIMLVGAVWFWWYAGSFSGGFGDPVGPTAFPRFVAVPTAICAVLVLLRPDPDGRWLHGRQSVLQLIALAILVAYPALIETLGFPASTTVCATGLALVLGAGIVAAIVTGVLSGLGLFALFDLALGLPLPAWPAL